MAASANKSINEESGHKFKHKDRLVVAVGVLLLLLLLLLLLPQLYCGNQFVLMLLPALSLLMIGGKVPQNHISPRLQQLPHLVPPPPPHHHHHLHRRRHQQQPKQLLQRYLSLSIIFSARPPMFEQPAVLP
jgi:hypothetical protein